MFKYILQVVFIALLSSPAFAKTLYVNADTGNDSVTYAQNSEASPWRTIGRAATGSTNRSSPNASEAAQPGDVVLIASGIYWESGYSDGRRFTVSLNPVNSGTESEPIVFRGVGDVYVRMLAGYRGGMIGCNARSYIVWDNFQIDDYYGGSTSDTGPVVFSGDAHHCQIINSDIKGHSGSYYHGYATYGGNYRGVSIEPANFITVKNNRIYQFTGGQNEAGIMMYDSNDNIVENNDIFNNGVAVFVKGIHDGRTQARNIIRKNFVYNNFTGIRILGSSDALVYQNIVVAMGNHGGLWAGFSTSERTRFVNNTVYGGEMALVPQGPDLVNVQFLNNIVANALNAIYNWDVSSPSVQNVSYNYNVYGNNNRHANYESGPRPTFSEWQSIYQLDLNSVNADPLFVDAAGGDFRLAAESPARNMAPDILDLNQNGQTNDLVAAGAYVVGDEIIGQSDLLIDGGGVGGGGGDPAPPVVTEPSPPANLR